MAAEPGNAPGNQPGNSPDDNAPARIIAYNLRKAERPGGMKVRYKIRIETGRKARDLDARQADVITELLRWARHYRAAHKEEGTR
jgi:hypothetical protein